MVALARTITIEAVTYPAGTDHADMPARIVDRIRNPDAWVGGVAPALSGSADRGRPQITPADLNSAPKARNALGLGTSAVRDVGTAAGTVAAGDDLRLYSYVAVYNARRNPFGASLAGDGVTNDQPALQAMIYAVAAAGGGAIYCPAGTYNIADHGTYWKTKVSLIGDGPGRTIFKLTNAGTGLPISLALHVTSLSQASFYNALTDCHFRDFEVDCSALTLSAYNVGCKPLNMQFMVRPRFDNLYIHDSPASGIGCDFLLDGVISRCVVERAGRLNDGTQIGGGGYGIGVGGYPDLNRTLTDASLTSGSDVLTSAAGAFPTSNWSSSSLPLVGAAVTGTGIPAGTKVVQIVDSTHLKLSANATATGTNVSVTLAGINSVEYLNTVIIGSVARDGNKHGAFFEAQSQSATYPKSKGCRIIGSSFTGNKYGVSDWGCDGLEVSDSVMSRNTADGYNIGYGVAGSTAVGANGRVHHCRIQDNTRDGVRFDDVASTSPYQILDNVITGNGTTGAGGHGVNLTKTNTTPTTGYIMIKRNRISLNGGAGIHTDVVADNSEWSDNHILGNGQNTGMTTSLRVGVSIENTISHLGLRNNRMSDTQGSKTQQNALYYTPSGNPSGWFMVGNDGIGNVNSGVGINGSSSFAFPNITASAAGRPGGNAASRMLNNYGLNGNAGIVTVSGGNTPASDAVYRVGACPEDLWFTVSGGTMTGLKIGVVAIPGLSGGVTSYGPVNADPNDGVTPTYTGTLTITARPR